MGARLCLERGAVPATRLPILDPAAGFSTDGFHASEAGYAAWAMASSASLSAVFLKALVLKASRSRDGMVRV